VGLGLPLYPRKKKAESPIKGRILRDLKKSECQNKGSKPCWAAASNIKGIIHYKYVPSKQLRKYSTLKSSRQSIHQKISNIGLYKRIVHHDNALYHTTFSVKQALAMKQISVFEY